MTAINPGLLMAYNAINKVDTKDYDDVLNNFQSIANSMSQNTNLGNWIYSVDGSDEARQRAENAAFQSYLTRTQPLQQQQTDDLQTRLINQGLTPGSEAYQRAMTDLQNNQNDANNLAAYQATLAGQQAFSNSLNDSIASANFANSAQSGAVNNVWNLLANSMSGYDKAMEQANIMSQIYNQYEAERQANKKGGWGGALKGAVQGGIEGFAVGGPWGAAAGAGLGAYQGYNS